MRSNAAVAALAVGLISACGFDSGGIGTGDAGPTTDAAESSTSESSSSATSMTGLPGTTTTSTTHDASAGMTTETDTGDGTDDTGGKSVPGSCAELLAQNPGAPTGVHFIAPPRSTMPVVPFRVYCDMDTDGGGWTLVARSVSGSFDPGGWGWESSRGNVDDDAGPYSLGVTAAGLKFEQLLVGNRGDGKAWSSHVYRMGVPPDFVSAHAQSGVETIDVQTIVGDCDPNGGPSNLQYAGHTAETYVYFFDNSDGYDVVGLTPTGFALPHTLCDCNCSADLDGDQGMIMVR